jgi:class 3 adenylate cyclase
MRLTSSCIVKTPYRCNTITDFLIAQPLTIDVELDDESTGCMSVKGIEFEATVLYAGISDFTRLSVELSPAEMLLYMNMFLTWAGECSGSERFFVIERFVDNALVLLFSTRFGSDDPFIDALQAARWMGEHDAMKFSPRIGIASGKVMAGFTGTHGNSNASVFGRPLALAGACARLNPGGDVASAITFPSDEWAERTLEKVFQPIEYDHPEKGRVRQPQTWTLGAPREVDFPGIGRLFLRDIASFIHWMPSLAAAGKAKELVRLIKSQGYYKKNN